MKGECWKLRLKASCVFLAKLETFQLTVCDCDLGGILIRSNRLRVRKNRDEAFNGNWRESDFIESVGKL
jgi:hypothetical protein